MNFHRLRILIISLTSIILLVIVSVAVFNYIYWNDVLKTNNKFIFAWGTYSYSDYSKYPDRVKPFLESTFFSDNFLGEENLRSNEIIGGNLTAQEKVVNVSNIKVTKRIFTNGSYVLNSTYTETDVVLGEKSTESRSIAVTFHKDTGVYLVSDVVYE